MGCLKEEKRTLLNLSSVIHHLPFCEESFPNHHRPLELERTKPFPSVLLDLRFIQRAIDKCLIGVHL